MNRFKVFDYHCFDKVDSEFVLERIRNSEYNGDWVACLNPHSIVTAESNAKFKKALMSATGLIPDGIGVCFAARILGRFNCARFTGADLFDVAIDAAEASGKVVRVCLLGATLDKLEKMKHNIESNSKFVEVVSIYSPPFAIEHSDYDLDLMARQVKSAKPDILIVGMTAPKQEIALAYMSKFGNFKIGLAIGAVIDFNIGSVKRIESRFIGTYFEWFIRLMQEPSRLWRRTFVSGPLFLIMIIKEILFYNSKRIR